MAENHPPALRRSLRALAQLLRYPNSELRVLLPQLSDALARESALGCARRAEIAALCRDLAALPELDAEARYVDLFDRGGSQTALHLFEHVHGDSRARGAALVDLLHSYERAGLLLTANELPDHLCVVLEFASTQPPALARAFLAEIAHLLNALLGALLARASPYASVIAAVLELAGERVQPLAPTAQAPVDETWAEPQAFGACGSGGPELPAAAAEPLHFVRRARAQQGVAR